MTPTLAPDRFTFRSETFEGVIWETERGPGGWRCTCRVGRRPARCWHLEFAEAREVELARAKETPVSEPAPTWQPYSHPDAPTADCGHQGYYRRDGSVGCGSSMLRPGNGGALEPCDGKANPGVADTPDQDGFISECPNCGAKRTGWMISFPGKCLDCFDRPGAAS